MVVLMLKQRWEILRQIDLQKMSILAKKLKLIEQRWQILQHYIENHGNVAECVRKLQTEEEKHRQLRMFVIL